MNPLDLKKIGSTISTASPLNVATFKQPSVTVPSTITSSNLAPAQSVKLPPPPVDTTNYQGITAGGNATIGANTGLFTTPSGAQVKADGTVVSAPQDQPAPQTSALDTFKSYMSSLIAPPSGAETGKQIYNDPAFLAKQNDVATQQQMEADAQGEFDTLNAQLQGIEAQTKALSLYDPAKDPANAGRGITQGGIQPQYALQNEQLRQYAINALPIQVNAMLAQAKLAHAQRKTAVAQGILQQAESHLDKLFQIQMQDAQNKYEHQNNIIDKVYEFATKQEQNKLDELKTQKANEFQTERDTIAFTRDIEKMKIQNSLSSGGGSDVPTIKSINGVDMQWDGTKWVTPTGATGGKVASTYQTDIAGRTLSSVSELISKAVASPQIFGRTAALPLPDFARSDAFRDYKAQLETLKANVFTSQLNAMREASKTGGAVGNVSDREGDRFANALGALDMAQSPAEVQKQLVILKDSVTNWLRAVGQASTATGTTVTAPDGSQVIITD